MKTFKILGDAINRLMNLLSDCAQFFANRIWLGQLFLIGIFCNEPPQFIYKAP